MTSMVPDTGYRWVRHEGNVYLQDACGTYCLMSDIYGRQPKVAGSVIVSPDQMKDRCLHQAKEISK